MDEQREVDPNAGISPEDAGKRLERLGYKKQDWVIFTEQELGSHYLRALASIAEGNQPRKLEDVYEELFPGEHRGPYPLEKLPDFNRIKNVNRLENLKEVQKRTK